MLSTLANNFSHLASRTPWRRAVQLAGLAANALLSAAQDPTNNNRKPCMNALTAGAHALRHDWTLSEVQDLFALPFNDLLFQAQTVHRAHFDPNEVQVSTLLSIKTGACPEDCKYCPQSARYHTGLETERLMEVEKVLERARRPRPTARPASAWGRPGATRKRRTCPTSCA